MVGAALLGIDYGAGLVNGSCRVGCAGHAVEKDCGGVVGCGCDASVKDYCWARCGGATRRVRSYRACYPPGADLQTEVASGNYFHFHARAGGPVMSAPAPPSKLSSRDAAHGHGRKTQSPTRTRTKTWGRARVLLVRTPHGTRRIVGEEQCAPPTSRRPQPPRLASPWACGSGARRYRIEL